MKIAIICDWLTTPGGAEKVVEALLEAFPEADLYSSVCDRSRSQWLADREVKTTWLDRIPFLRFKHQLFAPLRPMAFESFDLSKYDVVISSSSAESKCVITKPETSHICYCHTPTRYYWSDYHEYVSTRMEFGWLNWLVRKIMPSMVFDLRMKDRLAAERVDYFIANSKYVADRIRKYYRKDSKVIYPPVDFSSDSFGLKSVDEGYYIYLGRLVPYKRADIVVEACCKSGHKLKVIGDGPQKKQLQEKARNFSNIEFLGRLDDDKKREILSKCKGLIFPSLEDFGIVPLEAMSFGKPVVAYGVGGSRETVVENVTGVFFDKQEADSIVEAIKKCESLVWNETIIKERAKLFDKKRFVVEIRDFVNNIRSKKS